MKILSIIKKEVTTQLRNFSIVLIYTLMPIILILVLGVTFGNQMDGASIEIDDMTIKYVVQGEEDELTQGFLEMMALDEIGENNVVVKTDDLDGGLAELADAKITCLVIVDENEKAFTIYKNALLDTEASLVEAVMGTYVARYNAVMEIVKVNPQALAEIDLEKQAGSYSNLVALGKTSQVGGMDYYGIAMVILFVVYGILQSFANVLVERSSGTGNRILTSSLRKSEFFVGKLVGQLLTLVIQLALVIVFSALVFDVSWGPKPALPLLLVFTEMIMVVSIGITMGLTINTEGTGMTIGHIATVLFAFFGGSYVPLSQLGDLGMIGKYFSPIWWVQSGVINYIYLGETKTLVQAMIICLGITVLMFIIAIYKLGRTEGLEHA